MNGEVHRGLFMGAPHLVPKRLANEYQKHAIETASPVQLVIMMYDGALRFMEAGKHAMAARELERQNDALLRAQRIVFELMACLDMENGGEMASNLMSLYGYVIDQLVRANTMDEPDAIDRAMKVLSELRPSWEAIEAARKSDSKQSKAA